MPNRRPVDGQGNPMRQPTSRGTRRRRDDNPDQLSLPGFNNSGEAIAEQAAAARAMGEDTKSAIAQARGGDLTALMPYAPTPSINPPRPRTQRMGYDQDSESLFVQFRDGPVYQYMGVTGNEWRNMRRVVSPGKALNRTFNRKPYTRRFDLEG